MKMTGSGIEIKKLKRTSPEVLSDMIELYKDAGWWHDYDPSYLPEMVKKSFYFAGAFMDKKLIGMGRAISDGNSDAYIQDIVVLNDFRGQGIGSMIVSHIKEQLIKNGIDWIALIGEPGTEKFYLKLGFKPMKNFVPMKLEI